MFDRVADVCSRILGNPISFIVACMIVVAWAVSGPVFGFDDTWQLLINTGTTVATFLMVFILQHSQLRDTAALQAKLDELIRSGPGDNKLIGAEHKER